MVPLEYSGRDMTVAHGNDLYLRALEAFRAGENERSRQLNQELLGLACESDDDELLGRALTGLCRCALRDQDRGEIERLSEALRSVADRTGDANWNIVAIHMTAESARILGELELAASLYLESQRLSELAGHRGLVATEAFNLCMLELSRGRLQEAGELLRRHFAIRSELDEHDPDPYGLIGMAALLTEEARFHEAAVTAFACRRLLASRGSIPDPADERPLASAERTCRETLSDEAWQSAREAAASLSCADVVKLRYA